MSYFGLGNVGKPQRGARGSASPPPSKDKGGLTSIFGFHPSKVVKTKRTDRRTDPPTISYRYTYNGKPLTKSQKSAYDKWACEKQAGWGYREAGGESFCVPLSGAFYLTVGGYTYWFQHGTYMSKKKAKTPSPERIKEAYEAACKNAGVPPELIAQCASSRDSASNPDKFMQEHAAEAAEAALGARKKQLFMIGGAALAGLLVFKIIRR